MKTKIIQIQIDRLDQDGEGVGAGIHVPFTMPGDEADVEVRRRREGRLLQIIKASPERIEPKCIHFGECGGCKWQHIPYAQQLKIKQERLQDLFSGYTVQPIIPSPEWEYRNKMEFSFSENLKGDKYLGLMLSQGRGRVFNLTECHLVHDWFAKLLEAMRQWWRESGLQAYHPPSNRGSLRTLTVREGMTSGDRMVMLTVSGEPAYALNQQQLDSFTAYVRDAIEPIQGELTVFLRIQQAIKGRPTEFFEMQLYGKSDTMRETLNIHGKDLQFKVSPSAFFQPNTKQAEIIYTKALEQADIQRGSVVYDLYCGTGTLGLCAAPLAKEVVGIELSAESSLDARENAKANGLTNVTIYTGDVGLILEQKDLPKPDIILLDPPRAGLDARAMAQVIKLNVDKLVYISCNPKTQALNVSDFCAAGYEVMSIQPVDQFPHTVHVENIVILKRRHEV